MVLGRSSDLMWQAKHQKESHLDFPEGNASGQNNVNSALAACWDENQ